MQITLLAQTYSFDLHAMDQKGCDITRQPDTHTTQADDRNSGKEDEEDNEEHGTFAYESLYAHPNDCLAITNFRQLTTNLTRNLLNKYFDNKKNT